MPDQIRIVKAPGKWVVRAGGAVIGEASDALELSEGGHPPVIYFPRADIAMAFLERSPRLSHCPLKGEAIHYGIVTKSGTLADAAWSYETPNDRAARIAGHLAFYPGKVTVEQL